MRIDICTIYTKRFLFMCVCFVDNFKLFWMFICTESIFWFLYIIPYCAIIISNQHNLSKGLECDLGLWRLRSHWMWIGPRQRCNSNSRGNRNSIFIIKTNMFCWYEWLSIMYIVAWSCLSRSWQVAAGLMLHDLPQGQIKPTICTACFPKNTMFVKLLEQLFHCTNVPMF